jgi:pimeloyl-ACP methyl ester carboxylesterase
MDVNVTLFLCLAGLLRWLAAVGRPDRYGWPIRMLSWLPAALGGWALATAAGAWFPIWPAVVVGLVGGSVECFAGKRRPVYRAVAEAGLVLVAALVAVEAMPWPGALALAVGYAGIGAGLDWVHRRLKPGGQLAAWTLAHVALALAIGYGLGRTWFNARTLVQRHPTLLFSGGVLQPPSSRRIELPGQTAGWLSQPSGPRPRIGAVLFNGAHPHGSQQRDGVVLQHTLRAAGYTVLAVDHPASGQTPVPSPIDAVDQWDPLPAAKAAVRRLRRERDIEQVITVGHSMGCATVYKLLGSDAPVALGIVFGSGFYRERHQTMYRDFQADRNVSAGQVSHDLIDKIARAHLDQRRLANELDRSHPPVIFAELEHEWPDLKVTRDELYRMIPGVKWRWRVHDATHDLDSLRIFTFIVADTAVGRQLANGFAAIRQQVAEGKKLDTLGFVSSSNGSRGD